MKRLLKKIAGFAFTAALALTMAGCIGNIDDDYCWYESPVDAVTGLAATEASEYVLFGVFPKTIKKDDVKIKEKATVTMGGSTYYKGSDGEYYAKVTVKPNLGYYSYSDGTSVIDGNVDYFKVEPIKWKVLTKDYNGTKNALLLAEDILTAGVPYYEDYENTRTIDEKTVYQNNYEHSQMRAYLNGLAYQGQSGEVAKWKGNGFLQTAFTENAQKKIATTTVDNSAESTSDATGTLPKADGTYSSDSEDYTCGDTEDKIFLLSEKEVTTNTYGFVAYDKYGVETSRIRISTDYALANCAYMNFDENLGARWWLRSPNFAFADTARCVTESGYADGMDYIKDIVKGIVPALTISLK